MYNLPADTSINGNLVYHEGNHCELGDPHGQYLNSMYQHHTINTKENRGKWYKIAEIKYIPNTNVVFRYRIDVSSINEMCDSVINVKCGNNINDTKISMTTDDNLKCGVKLSTSTDENNNTINIIEVYLQINRVWWTVCYRLSLADNVRYFHYNDGYAFNRILFFNEMSAVDSLDSDIEIEYLYNATYSLSETSAVSVSSNSTAYLNIDFPGLVAEKNFIEITPIGSIPAELSYHWFLPSDNQVRIVVRNHTSYTKEIPKMKWNIKIQRLS